MYDHAGYQNSEDSGENNVRKAVVPVVETRIAAVEGDAADTADDVAEGKVGACTVPVAEKTA